MSEIQRHDQVGEYDGDITEHGEGDWVKYADHAARVAELERAVEVLAGSILDMAQYDRNRRGPRDSSIDWFIPCKVTDNPTARAAVEAAKGEVK